MMLTEDLSDRRDLFKLPEGTWKSTKGRGVHRRAECVPAHPYA